MYGAYMYIFIGWYIFGTLPFWIFIVFCCCIHINRHRPPRSSSYCIYKHAQTEERRRAHQNTDHHTTAAAQQCVKTSFSKINRSWPRVPSYKSTTSYVIIIKFATKKKETLSPTMSKSAFRDTEVNPIVWCKRTSCHIQLPSRLPNSANTATGKAFTIIPKYGV